MFYSTTIKSVGSGGVIDAQGRYLNFIGDLPVKEGDTVFTDGKIIFGNAPPKGSPAVFDPPSGIPVLGVEDSDSENELRGYFTMQGKFKKYSVNGDDWITNAEKTYAHDGEDTAGTEIDGQKVIDAEIAHDKNDAEDGVYTAEKFIYAWEGEVPSDEFKCSVTETGERFGETNIDFTVTIANTGSKTKKFSPEKETWSRFITADEAEFAQKNGTVIKNCELIVKKNSAELTRLNFPDLIQEAENRAWSFISDIPVIGHTSEDEIETRAVLENFKIAADGHWEALVWIDILAKRTFYVENAATDVYVSVFRDVNYTYAPVEELQIEDPSIAEAVFLRLHNLFGVQGIQTTTATFTLNTVVTSPKSYNSSVCTHHCFFVKLSSDTLQQNETSLEQEILFETMRYFPLYFIETELHHPVTDCVTTLDDYYEDTSEGYTLPIYSVDRRAIEKKFDLPCEYPDAGRPNAGYPLTWYTTGSAFVGSSKNISTVYLVPAGETLYQEATGEIYLAVLIFRVYDSRDWIKTTNLSLTAYAPDYLGTNIAYSRKDDFSFPVQDDYYAKLTNSQIASWLYDTTGRWRLSCQIDGLYDKNDNRIADGTSSDEENAHQWNMSLATLKGGKYLFGIHGDPSRDINGELYKIDSAGKAELVGDGLKNFRLREMKNIRKAKK